MKIRALLSAGGLVAALAGCLDSTGAEFTCGVQSPTQASVSGDTVTLSSGLRYIDTRAGSGDAAENCLGVAVHYDRYRSADSTSTPVETSRGGQPVVFTLGAGDLITGFEQGVMGMRVGGTRRLFIPPSLGYGSSPVTDRTTGAIIIPANSTLVFDVELVAAQ